MEASRTDPIREPTVDDVERGAGAGERGAGDVTHQTLEPGESVVVVPAESSGATTVVEAAPDTIGAMDGGGMPTPGAGTTGAEGRDWLSMSTDNTAAGRTGDITNTGPIDLAMPGMRVYDANGDDLGKVDSIKMGDPAAVTSQGEEPDGGNNLIDEIGRTVFGGESLPDQIRHNLLRVGYLRVDGKGWLFDTDFFVAADQIAGVEGDAVRLNVTKDTLPSV